MRKKIKWDVRGYSSYVIYPINQNQILGVGGWHMIGKF